MEIKKILTLRGEEPGSVATGGLTPKLERRPSDILLEPRLLRVLVRFAFKTADRWVNAVDMELIAVHSRNLVNPFTKHKFPNQSAEHPNRGFILASG
jgi:hypothetical protein